MSAAAREREPSLLDCDVKRLHSSKGHIERVYKGSCFLFTDGKRKHNHSR